MGTIGHGHPTTLSAVGALAMAAEATPDFRAQVDPIDPQNFCAGQPIGVTPCEGGPTVFGTLVQLDRERVALRRTHARVNEVMVHFPRLGYRISEGVA